MMGRSKTAYGLEAGWREAIYRDYCESLTLANPSPPSEHSSLKLDNYTKSTTFGSIRKSAHTLPSLSVHYPLSSVSSSSAIQVLYASPLLSFTSPLLSLPSQRQLRSYIRSHWLSSRPGGCITTDPSDMATRKKTRDQAWSVGSWSDTVQEVSQRLMPEQAL